MSRIPKLVVAAASSSVLLASLLCAPPASAARACGPTQYGFAGAQSAFATSVFGARAQIEYNNPDLCGSDADGSGFSTAWSMVDAWSADDPDHNHSDWIGYAQAGYYQAGGSVAGYSTGIWEWSQYSSKCVSHGTCGTDAKFHNSYYGHPSGTHMYANYRSSSDGHVHMTVDGNQIDETNYDPTGDWAAAWQGEFYGEVHDWGTDIPGTDGDRTTLNYLQKYESNGNINFFSSVTGTTTANTRYHRDVFDAAVGGKAVNVWTDPL